MMRKHASLIAILGFRSMYSSTGIPRLCDKPTSPDFRPFRQNLPLSFFKLAAYLGKSKSSRVISWTHRFRRRDNARIKSHECLSKSPHVCITTSLPVRSLDVSRFETNSCNAGFFSSFVTRWFKVASKRPWILTTNVQSSSVSRAFQSRSGTPTGPLIHSISGSSLGGTLALPMPLVILVLARRAVLYFTRINLGFWNGNDSLCQSGKFLEWGRLGWFGVGHKASVLHAEGECNQWSFAATS